MFNWVFNGFLFLALTNSSAGNLFNISYYIVHSFGANGDGKNPYAALISLQGALYSTTAYGGASSNSGGTVFELFKK